MKLLITGGSGFIGSNVVSYFENKYEMMNIDKAEPKERRHLKYWKNVDINNYELLNETISGFDPDYIIHLAARTDLEGQSLEDYSANIGGVKNILEITKRLIHLKKIIITSSMLVCHVGYIPKTPFDYSATTLYGKSKVETERLTWAADLKCDWAIIRPTSIWGPGFKVPYRNFFNMVKKRMYFHIGKRGCTKTYGYIGNSVYQIEQILNGDTTNRGNKVFYIGDMPPINIKEWADQISHELGFKVPAVPWLCVKCAAYLGDMLEMVGIKFPMTSFRLKNMTTDNIVDLKPTYNMAPNPPFTRIEGIRETLRWLENN